MKIAVIGAGMAGLSAAYELQKAGADVTVFESADAVGGRTLTRRQSGFQMDTGAIYVSPGYTQTNRIISELGLEQALVKVQPKMGFLRDGECHPLDLASPGKSFVKTRLLSFTSKLMLAKLLPRILKLWRNINFGNMGSLAIYDHESTQDYCSRVLNQELHDYFVDPIIRINMLNKTHASSSGELFWLLKSLGAPYIYVLTNGTSTIAEALAGEIEVLTGSTVGEIRHEADSVKLTYTRNDASMSQVFDGCIVTTPPDIALQLCPSIPKPEQTFFRQVQPIKHMVISLGLSRILPLQESTILGSEKESPNLLTIVIDPNRAPGRSAQGHTVVTLWMTEDWSRQLWDTPDDEVVKHALSEVLPIIGDVAGEVAVNLVTRSNYSCFKGYPGYYQNLDHYMRAKTRDGRLLFAGDFAGIGIEGAVISGQSAATDMIGSF
ncbi:MAG: NAD(P)/FAD-dependent oxidoreductase [Halieaceae bacterium]|nr:NAD(P)/FAD-dependent oxidoreductase [Halieaceae bacterium]